MSDPGYDFFATGRPQPPPGSPALPEPPVAAPPVHDVVYNAPAPSAEFRRPDGVVVNQFGTPVGTSSAPTGPYAAPGIGAAPMAAPGMVSTWGGAPAPAAAGRSASRAAAPSSSGLVPRNVRAVAVLALFFAAFLAWIAVNGWMAYQRLSSQLGSVGGSSAFAEAIMATLLVGLVLLTAVTATLVAGGVGTLAGKRWGGWVLVVSYALYLMSMVRQFASGGFAAFDLIFVVIALVLLLVLVTGEGLAWLTGKRA